MHTQATVNPGAWTLPANDVWNVPADVGEQRFEIETVDRAPWPYVRITGLAVTLDGKIFGMRTMNRPRESGYQQEGRVSVGGKKYRAFTSSTLFERPDGSLVDVGVLVVCGYPE